MGTYSDPEGSPGSLRVEDSVVHLRSTAHGQECGAADKELRLQLHCSRALHLHHQKPLHALDPLLKGIRWRSFQLTDLIPVAAELKGRLQALTLFSSMMSLRKAGSFTRLRVTARWTSGWFTCACGKQLTSLPLLLHAFCESQAWVGIFWGHAQCTTD